MKIPKEHKPNKDALPPLIDDEAEQQRIKSIKQRKEQIEKEQEKWIRW